MIGQINIFEISKPKYKIKKPIRLIELFAGIGSQAKALKNIGANFEHYRATECHLEIVNTYQLQTGLMIIITISTNLNFLKYF